MGNEGLDVRDIGEVTDADGLRLSGGGQDQRGGKDCDKFRPLVVKA
jgi:hypothetical protein